MRQLARWVWKLEEKSSRDICLEFIDLDTIILVPSFSGIIYCYFVSNISILWVNLQFFIILKTYLHFHISTLFIVIVLFEIPYFLSPFIIHPLQVKVHVAPWIWHFHSWPLTFAAVPIVHSYSLSHSLIFILFVFVLLWDKVSLQLRLILTSLCGSGWPQICNPTSPASWYTQYIQQEIALAFFSNMPPTGVLILSF